MANSKAAPASEQAASTTLDSDVTKPSNTAPGDGPADTTDPTERATSVPSSPGPEALRAGTVNAVVPMGDVVPTNGLQPDGGQLDGTGEADQDRIEEYDVVDPQGVKVRIRHNIDRGTTEKV